MYNFCLFSVSISRDLIHRKPATTQISRNAKERAVHPSFCEKEEGEKNIHQDKPMDCMKTNEKTSQIVKKLNMMKTRKEKSCSETSLQDKSLAPSNETQETKTTLVEQGSSSSVEIKKKTPKNVNAIKFISSLQSQIDVERLLKNESKKRSVTSTLGDDQWGLLKIVLGKLNIKLKKADDEKKKKQILDQIKKAFKIALS